MSSLSRKRPRHQDSQDDEDIRSSSANHNNEEQPSPSAGMWIYSWLTQAIINNCQILAAGSTLSPTLTSYQHDQSHYASHPQQTFETIARDANISVTTYMPPPSASSIPAAAPDFERAPVGSQTVLSGGAAFGFHDQATGIFAAHSAAANAQDAMLNVPQGMNFEQSQDALEDIWSNAAFDFE